MTARAKAPGVQRLRPGLGALSLSLVLGALAALGQAPWDMWYVTIPALAVLIWRLSGSGSARASAWHAFTAGLGYFAVAMSWITEPFLVEPNVYGWMAPFALALMAAGGALFWTLPGWISGRFGRSPATRAVLFATALVLSDWLRGWLFTGLPWALTGHIWINTPAGQFAAVAGSIGLSALTMIAACLPVWLRRAGPITSRAFLPGILLSALLIATAWSFGLARLAAPSPADTAFHLRLVQPNATQALKWDPYWSEIFFQRLIDLSAARDEGRAAPDAVIWPETAINFLLEQSGDAPQQIAEVAGAPVILGIQRAEDGRYFNSLTEFSSNGVGPVYDKFHLVPFGEYTPLGDVAAHFGIRAFAARYGAGYSAGDGPKTMSLANLPPVQPLICYEAVFSRHLITGADRPDWLLQVTNDAWFGALSGPWQHLAQARLRAIESGLPMMRAANTGVSAVIGPRGELRATLGLGLEGRIDARLPGHLPPTPWSHFGDWPVLALMLAVGLWAAARPKLHG